MEPNEADLAAFAARLRDVCAERGLPYERGIQTKLGHALGVTQQACSKWLTGKGWPSRDELLKIAAWAKVLPGWLAYGAGPKSHGDLYQDADIQTIVGLYERMDDSRKDAMLNVAKSLSGDAPNNHSESRSSSLQ